MNIWGIFSRNSRRPDGKDGLKWPSPGKCHSTGLTAASSRQSLLRLLHGVHHQRAYPRNLMPFRLIFGDAPEPNASRLARERRHGVVVVVDQYCYRKRE